MSTAKQEVSNLDLQPSVIKEPSLEIAIHSIVKRKSDGNLFRVKKINRDGTVWLSWYNEFPPLVDILDNLSNLELANS